MKTREEVLDHLLKNGYENEAINKIMGFMVAKELKQVDEVVAIKKGKLIFDDFYKWFNGNGVEEKECGCECECDYCPTCVIESLIEDCLDRLEWEMRWFPYLNVEKVQRIKNQLAFLYDIYVLEEEGEEVESED